MKSVPQPESQTERILVVQETHSIALGRGDVKTNVFSTPSMILLLELAAKQLLDPYLEEDEDSVGASVEVEHLAPTPVGAEVRAVAKLLSINASQFFFSIEAHDQAGLIGRGKHTRAVVRVGKIRKALQTRHPSSMESPALPRQFATERIILKTSDRMAELVLNRPEKHHAIDEAMTQALEQSIEELSKRKDLGLLIVRSSGKAFCAGEDIKENAALNATSSLRLAARRAEICRRLASLPIPIIARVDGICMGGGLMLALAADWIYATHASVFALPEIKLGWPPAYGMERLIQRTGFSSARDLCLLGETINASTALKCGLIDHVVAPAMLDDAISQLSSRLLSLAPHALSECRRLLRGDSGDPHTLNAYERARANPAAQRGIETFLRR